uniref:Claudin n=1 Tax=Labrus bergylta TaxID=56723 RepID=A0A3Q3FX85_9LABR
MPTEIWKIATLDGIVLGTTLITSNLWKNCVGDSTGRHDCKIFPSMLALDGHIQAYRGLMITAICLGFFGSILALFGMKCTKIGGTVANKSIIAFVAGLTFILSGKYSESLFIIHFIICVILKSFFSFRPVLTLRMFPHNRVFQPKVCGAKVRTF